MQIKNPLTTPVGYGLLTSDDRRFCKVFRKSGLSAATLPPIPPNLSAAALQVSILWLCCLHTTALACFFKMSLHVYVADIRTETILRAAWPSQSSGQ